MILGLLVAAIASGSYLYVRWRTTRFDQLIKKVAAKHQLDFNLVKSIIHEESWYDPEAKGPSGEMGLMQVTPLVAYEYAYKHNMVGFKADWLLDPGTNLEVGCWFLRQSLERYKQFDDPLPFALAGYNAGQSRVDGWIKAANKNKGSDVTARDFLASIGFPQTRVYVLSVLRRYRGEDPQYKGE